MARSIKKLQDLSGRKALVTGAAGQLGLHVCETLLELGAASVAVLDRNEAACAKRAKTLGRKAWALPCDLLDEDATRAAARLAVKKMGGLDILIHAAAFVGTTNFPGWAVPLDRQSVKAWDAAFRVNTTSAFILVQETRHALAASGRGSVIFFSSIYGSVGPDHGLYEGTPMVNPAGFAASKGGLVQLTRYLATTLAPRVRVNTLSPGGVWDHQPAKFHARYKARTPMGRMAAEEDIKGAIAYLAGDLSAYVTGTNLAVDGGWTAW